MRCCHHPPVPQKGTGRGIKRGLEGGPPTHTLFWPLDSLGVSQAPGPAPRSLVSQSQPLSSQPRPGRLHTGPMGPGNQSSWSPAKYFSRLGQGPSGDREGCRGRGCSFIRLFIHFFLGQIIFIEHPLCGRHCARCGGFSDRPSPSPSPHPSYFSDANICQQNPSLPVWGLGLE